MYDELRALAARFLHRERPGHTLEPTALVHEAYLRIARSQAIDWNDKNHFFAVAARCIRRLLVEHARGRRAGQAGIERITLVDEAAAAQAPAIDILALDESLERLAELNERQARVVELRFLGGLSVEEVADVLDISPGTVKNDWRFARAWLRARIEGGGSP